MFQYAASSGTVPFTLKHSNINDHFLLQQDQLGIEYMDTDLDAFYNQLDSLLDDSRALQELSAQMKSSVPNQASFEKKLEELLTTPLGSIDPSIQYYSFDESIVLNELLSECAVAQLNTGISRRHLPCCFFLSPIRFILGTIKDISDLL